MIDQRVKKRYCGYCRNYLFVDMKDFQKHINWCELAVVCKCKIKRKKPLK